MPTTTIKLNEIKTATNRLADIQLAILQDIHLDYFGSSDEPNWDGIENSLNMLPPTRANKTLRLLTYGMKAAFCTTDPSGDLELTGEEFATLASAYVEYLELLILDQGGTCDDLAKS